MSKSKKYEPAFPPRLGDISSSKKEELFLLLPHLRELASTANSEHSEELIHSFGLFAIQAIKAGDKKLFSQTIDAYKNVNSWRDKVAYDTFEDDLIRAYHSFLDADGNRPNRREARMFCLWSRAIRDLKRKNKKKKAPERITEEAIGKYIDQFRESINFPAIFEKILDYYPDSEGSGRPLKKDTEKLMCRLREYFL